MVKHSPQILTNEVIASTGPFQIPFLWSCALWSEEVSMPRYVVSVSGWLAPCWNTFFSSEKHACQMLFTDKAQPTLRCGGRIWGNEYGLMFWSKIIVAPVQQKASSASNKQAFFCVPVDWYIFMSFWLYPVCLSFSRVQIVSLTVTYPHKPLFFP